MIDQVIFDLDGTISDTQLIAVPAFIEGARLFGYPVVEDDTVKQAIGHPGISYYTNIYPQINIDELESFAFWVEAEERRRIRQLGRGILFSGIVSVMKVLSDNQIGLWLASSGTDEHVNTIIDSSAIRDVFDGMAYGSSNKSKLVEQIIAHKPSSCWCMVGDTIFDFRAARDNKIPIVGARYGYGTRDVLARCDYIIDKPEDLIHLPLFRNGVMLDASGVISQY